LRFDSDLNRPKLNDWQVQAERSYPQGYSSKNIETIAADIFSSRAATLTWKRDPAKKPAVFFVDEIL
jgi:hypothetical protein